MTSAVQHSYRIYDVALLSNVEIPELPASTTPADQISFSLRTSSQLALCDDWFHRMVTPEGSQKPGREVMLIARRGADFLVRFPRMVDFEVSHDGTRISATPVPTLSDVTLRHLLIDQVVPQALALGGRWIIHASAVVTSDGNAALFAARSGSGKSTLAGALVQAGCSLLSDDGILLKPDGNQMSCVAGYAGVRLWDDSAKRLYGPEPAVAGFAHYSEKSRIALEANAIAAVNRPVRLSRFYFLGEPGISTSISMTPMTPREACIELVKSSYILDVEDSTRIQANFERFAKLASRPVFFRLNYPRSWEQLPIVAQTIRDHASQG